ncbi:MAG: YqgE/AlgH family protein [Chitinophagaceae bacterium]|nr:YqgE/AlgH family protein [Chitinophagaceae bacterium]
MHAGIFLHSTSLLDDTFFEKAQIFITEHNEKGAMGFVVNHPFPRRFNELEEFRHSMAFPMYEGGPVDREHLFFIHQRPDLIDGGTLVAGNIYVGGNFNTAVRLINNKTLTEKDIKLFIGYCGWDDKELEAEIEEGSWEPMEEGDLF